MIANGYSYMRCPDCEAKHYLYCFQYPHPEPRITMREDMKEITVKIRVFK